MKNVKLFFYQYIVFNFNMLINYKLFSKTRMKNTYASYLIIDVWDRKFCSHMNYEVTHIWQAQCAKRFGFVVSTSTPHGSPLSRAAFVS